MAQNTHKTNYYNIDPLNGDNYEAWKFRVKMILPEHNVEQMIFVKYRVENYETDQLREEAKRKENKCKSTHTAPSRLKVLLKLDIFLSQTSFTDIVKSTERWLKVVS